MNYIKSLDTLRAFAVLAVIFDHWALVIDHGQFVPSFLHPIPFGTIGVNVFFVISGFLISGILLGLRESIDENKLSLKKAFKIFYIRRTLRIFPIYYLMLILLLIFAPYLFEFDKYSYIWFFSYMTNFFMYFRADWIGDFMPLWSLGVEEQFYLLWPLIILLINKKYILHAIIVIIFVGIFSRFYFEYLSTPEIFRKGFHSFTTPTCFDSFGLGALLTYLIRNDHFSRKLKLVLRVISIFSFVIFLFLIVYLKFPTPIQGLLYRLLISLMALQIIVVLMSKNRLSDLFENKITGYIGKISYSMYLFHNFLPNIYQKLNTYFFEHNVKIPFTNYSIIPFVGGNIQLILYLLVLIFLSSVSWFFFEKPINNLKRKFNYQ
jgi:peptidoglycan/LPS O-acetylase OafA/YrhL